MMSDAKQAPAQRVPTTGVAHLPADVLQQRLARCLTGAEVVRLMAVNKAHAKALDTPPLWHAKAVADFPAADVQRVEAEETPRTGAAGAARVATAAVATAAPVAPAAAAAGAAGAHADAAGAAAAVHAAVEHAHAHVHAVPWKRVYARLWVASGGGPDDRSAFVMSDAQIRDEWPVPQVLSRVPEARHWVVPVLCWGNWQTGKRPLLRRMATGRWCGADPIPYNTPPAEVKLVLPDTVHFHVSRPFHNPFDKTPPLTADDLATRRVKLLLDFYRAQATVIRDAGPGRPFLLAIDPFQRLDEGKYVLSWPNVNDARIQSRARNAVKPDPTAPDAAAERARVAAGVNILVAAGLMLDSIERDLQKPKRGRLYVVMTKADLRHNKDVTRYVTRAEVEVWANANKAECVMECSALTGEGVTRVFRRYVYDFFRLGDARASDLRPENCAPAEYHSGGKCNLA